MKKLSFVLIASSEENYDDFGLNKREMINDSRGSCAEVGLFKEDARTHIKTYGLIPAYLVVIELE